MPGSTVLLREAVADDVAAIVSLLVDDQVGAGRDSTADLGPYRRAFEAIAADPAHVLVVASDGPAVVGTLQLSVLPGMARRGARRGQIEGVRVRRDHRSRGLGAAMIQWAVDEARRRGCTVVQLTSDKSRADAHRLYTRLGFVASHEGFKLTL